MNQRYEQTCDRNVNKAAAAADAIQKKLIRVASFETFQADTFGGYNAACSFLDAIKMSYGSMQRNEPIGIANGVVQISKWHNLKGDITELDGVIISDDFREGTVHVYLSEEYAGRVATLCRNVMEMK